MSTTMRPTLQTVPESLPADHVTTPAQATPTTPAQTNNIEKSHPVVALPVSQPGPTPATVNLKPRSSSSRVSGFGQFLLSGIICVCCWVMDECFIVHLWMIRALNKWLVSDSPKNCDVCWFLSNQNVWKLWKKLLNVIVKYVKFFIRKNLGKV